MPAERTLTLDGREQRLEPRIAGLLDELVDQSGQTLGREELLDRVWGDEGSDEALTQAVSRLRQLLGDRNLIRTEPRKGYRLVTAAVPVLETAAGVSGASTPSPHRFSSRVVQLAFAAGFVTALVFAALGWALFGPKPVTVFEEITRPIEGTAPPETRTVRCEGSPEECERQFLPAAPK